jgi:glycolate oxidase FAD binding subunit
MIPRADAPRLARELNSRHWLGDLAGAVLWLAADPSEGPRIREIAARANGQAMLLRGSAESRTSLGLFAPQAPALATLGRAVKAAFDPLSLFNPGRL